MSHGLDIIDPGGRQRPPATPPPPDAASDARPALQVYFRCANAYIRVLRAADGTHYLCRCPKCGKSTRFIVGQGGTEQRYFEMSCR